MSRPLPLAMGLAGRFFRVLLLGAWSATPVLAEPPADGGLLYPDLRAVVPQHVQISHWKNREYIRFAADIANTGAGRLHLRRGQETKNAQGKTLLPAIQLLFRRDHSYIEQVVGAFEYHRDHDHFHIERMARYELRKDNPTGTLWGPPDGKVSFCLRDDYQIDEQKREVVPFPYHGCNSNHQGLSPGWADHYNRELSGQYLDITEAPTGTYYLVFTVDPQGQIREENAKNNTAWLSFTLSRFRDGAPLLQVTGHSSCEPGLCGEKTPPFTLSLGEVME